MEKFLTKNQKGIFVVMDVIFIIISFVAASLFMDVYNELHGTYYFIVCIALCCVFHGVSFECFKLYNTIWLYAGISDYFKVLRTMVLDIVAVMVLFSFLQIALHRLSDGL